METTNPDSKAVIGGGADAGTSAAAAAAVVRGRCEGDADGGGDGGLEWDGASGYLYLTDRLPSDGPGELAYFRAPGKFLGDQLQNAYNATLSYELYLAGGGDPAANAGATPTTPHDPGSDAEQAPDAILIGGRPRYRLQAPPWEVWDKHAIFEWSREHFPELPLNLRWSKERMVTTVEAYLDTPQVVLGIRARRMKHYPPERCDREHCSVNFNFDLNENDAWVNLATIPAGFGWSTDHHAGGDNPHVAWAEGAAYAGQKPGAPYNPFDTLSPDEVSSSSPSFSGGGAGASGSGYPGSYSPPDPRATAAGAERTRGDGGESAWTWDRGDGSRVPSRGDAHLADVLRSVGAWGPDAVAGGDSEAAMRQILDAINDPAKPNMPPGAQGAYPGGAYPGGGGLAGSWWNSDVENYNDGSSRSIDTRKLLARWDVLPEVRVCVFSSTSSTCTQLCQKAAV